MGVCIGRLPEFCTLGLVGLGFRVPFKGAGGLGRVLQRVYRVV